MNNIKDLVEMVRRTEPDAAEAQPKLYSNPKWDQYRSQQERYAKNKQALFYHFSDTNEVRSVSDALNNIHTAFDQFSGDKGTKAHNDRMTNVTGFLADVAASGVEYGRAVTLKKLPPEEMAKVKKIGKDRAVKLAMHAFAHALLPRVLGIEPAGQHHGRMDQDVPRFRNHEFISHTLSKGLLPPDVLTLKENKALGSELIGDAYSFLKDKHAEVQKHFRNFSDRAYEVGQHRGGVQYDHDNAHWIDRTIDLAAALGSKRAMDYVKAIGPVKNAERPGINPETGKLAHPELGTHAAPSTFLNPTAHHKYTSTFEHPREIAADRYHQAVAANDQEAIYAAHRDYETAPRVAPRQRVSVAATPPPTPPTETRSLGTFKLSPGGDPPVHPDLLPAVTTSGRTDVRNRKAPLAFPHDTPITLPDNVHDDAYDWMHRDEQDLKSFAQTVASQSEPKQIAHQPRDVVTQTTSGGSYHVDPTLVHGAPEHVKNPEMEIIPPPRRSTHDLDSLNPNAEYPSDLGGLSDAERAKLKATSIKAKVSGGAGLKDKINQAVGSRIGAAKDRLGGWNQDVPATTDVKTGLDFKHKPYEPKPAEPTPAPLSFHTLMGYGNGLAPLHDVLTGAANFSTAGHATEESAAAMVGILGPTKKANKVAGVNTPTAHAARVWQEVHNTVSSNPDLHLDKRAHAALHFARLAFNHYDKTRDYPPGDNEEYHIHDSGTYLHDMGNILAPSNGAVHPALQALGNQYHAQAKEMYDRADPVLPELDKLHRDVKATIIRRKRRIARSEGAAKVKDIINNITNHPWYQHVTNNLSDAWKNVTEEEQIECCDMLIENQWPKDWFGYTPSADTDVFDSHVYHHDGDRDGLMIPRHPKPRTVLQISKEDAHLKDDKVAQHMISIGTSDIMPLNKARGGNSAAVTRADLALRHALEDRSRFVQEHNNLMDEVKTNPRAVERVMDIQPPAMHSLGKVSELMQAIHDHLSPTHEGLNLITTHYLNNNMNVINAKAIKKSVVDAASAVAPTAQKVAKAAISGVADMAHDAIVGPAKFVFGQSPNSKFQPKSTPGKLATRVAIAAKHAPGAALDFLSGPDALAGPGAGKTLAQAKTVRANQYRDDLADAGLRLDPLDKSIDASTRKRATKLRTAAAIDDIIKKKRARG